LFVLPLGRGIILYFSYMDWGYIFWLAVMGYSIYQYGKLEELKKKKKYYNEALHELYKILGWTSLGALLFLGAG